MHCVKSVQIQSYFWSLFCCIRTEYRKIRTRNKPVFGHFSQCDGLSRYYSSNNLLTKCYKLSCQLLEFILERSIKTDTSTRRSRMPFSMEEQDYMIQGVRKFGVGQWAKILRQFDFHPSRTSVAIKDKYRTMKRQGFF